MFVAWLRIDSNDVFRAYCRVYQHSFDVKNMGEGADKSYGAGAKAKTCRQHDAVETADTNCVDPVTVRIDV